MIGLTKIIVKDLIRKNSYLIKNNTCAGEV